MAKYICAFYPKKSAVANGAVAIATCLETKTAKLAEMKASVAIEEAFPDTADNFFKPKICELTEEINGRPPIDAFDDEWLKFNVWNDETKTFDHIPTPTPDEELDPLLSAKVIFDLPITERVTYIAMYGAQPDQLDPEQLSNAVDMYNDPDMPDDLLIMIQGMLKVPSIAAMYPSSVAEIMDRVRAVMPPAETANEVAQLATGYASKPAERDTSDLQRTYETLDLEVALHVMGINPDEAKASHIRDAKFIKYGRDPAWRAWATSLRVIPGILAIPRGELWALMADGHKDLKMLKNADARRDYISSKLHGHPLLPDYQPEEAKVESLGGGKFSIEGLAEQKNAKGDTATDRRSYLNMIRVAVAKVVSGELSALISKEEILTLIPGDMNKDMGVSITRNIFDCVSQVDKENQLGKMEAERLTAAILRAYEPMDLFDADNLEAFITSWIASGDQTVSSTAVKTELSTASAVTTAGTNAAKADTNRAKPAPKSAISEAKPAEPVTKPAEVATTGDEFQARAAVVESEISNKSPSAKENLSIWQSVQRTDPRFTKPLTGTGFTGTSINSAYMFMRATEVFGPIGTGWGCDVIEDKMIPGAPMSEAIFNGDKFVRNEILRNSDGSVICELNHSLKIRLWYVRNGKRGEVEAYGATPYMYKSKRGIIADSEVNKKSFTDAMKKALSLLGFSADVFLGMHDDMEYLKDNATEFAIKNASTKADDVIRMREELDERFKANTETLRKAVTANEVDKISSSLNRELGVHLKSAQATGDKEHEKYLSGRLARLIEIRKECLDKFTTLEAKA